ncbi:MAG: hypothetical protein JXB29_04330 [Sedimentisphaerales bacterium]|nr:hypothetical protein [Sedimentisphaerales bacterium]
MKKHRFETCTECEEVFSCEIFVRRKVAQWIPAFDNLRRIKESGLKSWLKEQKERQALVEELLGNYNDGRSMSFFCKACARMPVELINKAIKETKKKILSEKVDESDVKAKAKILKSDINDKAVKYNIKMDQDK